MIKEYVNEYVIYDVRDKQIINFFDSFTSALDSLCKLSVSTIDFLPPINCNDSWAICSLDEWNELYQDIVNDEKY